MSFSEKDLALLRAHANAADGDLELLRAKAEEMMNRRNSAPLDDFAGLSPEQMTAFLYHAFDSPELIELREVLTSEPAAPILDLLLPLFEQLAQKPLKLTAKGNLPTAFVKEMAASYDPTHDENLDLTKEYAHNEDSFMDLHVARTVADLAGLVYKRHGKLHLTKRAAKLQSDHGAAGLYPALLRTYLGKFNWAYSDGFGPLPLIQQSWAFSCYLLQRFGNQPRPESFYAERFLTAFPALMREVAGRPHAQPEETIRWCYSLRTLKRFFGFLGLATYSWERKPLSAPVGTLTRTPLLLDAIKLKV